MGHKENKVQKRVLKYLKQAGIEAWRQNNHAIPIIRPMKFFNRIYQVLFGWRKDRWHRLGKGDVSGILKPHGRRLEIECKDIAGTQSDEQKKFQAVIESHGGLYILATDVQHVDEILRKEGYVSGEAKTRTNKVSGLQRSVPFCRTAATKGK